MELTMRRRNLDEAQLKDNMHLVTWLTWMHINKEIFRNAIYKDLKSTNETFKSICIQLHNYQVIALYGSYSTDLIAH